jgi:hypothetical protein
VAENDADFELLPVAAGEALDADTALDAAEASVLDDPLRTTEPEDPPIPYGRTPAFDFASGRFIRVGDGATPWVSGRDALRQWFGAMLATGRGACPIFSDEFGIENPDDYIGGVDPDPELATLEDRLREGVQGHDRIEDIDDFEVSYDPSEGVITLLDLTIITDEQEAVVVGSFDVGGN